jgi:hypothetical protein
MLRIADLPLKGEANEEWEGSMRSPKNPNTPG